MFGDKDDFSDELRRLRKKNNVSRVRSTLSSDGVLDVKQGNIREIVDYTEKGVGTIKATTTGKHRYNSREHAKHDKLDTEQRSPDFWVRLGIWLRERY